MQSRSAYNIAGNVIIFYFKELIFCFATIAHAIIVSTFLLLILRDGDCY